MKKITLFGCILLVLFLLVVTSIPATVSQKSISEEINRGKALFAAIYLELDPNSPQVTEIIDNRKKFPEGFLTNIEITIPDPNDEDGEWFMIAPFMRTIIGDWIGISPYFDIIEPKETTKIHIPLFWGDIHYWPPDSETPEEFIIDGWVPLISWEY
jgi:hypothetical protein